MCLMTILLLSIAFSVETEATSTLVTYEVSDEGYVISIPSSVSIGEDSIDIVMSGKSSSDPISVYVESSSYFNHGNFYLLNSNDTVRIPYFLLLGEYSLLDQMHTNGRFFVYEFTNNGKVTLNLALANPNQLYPSGIYQDTLTFFIR